MSNQGGRKPNSPFNRDPSSTFQLFYPKLKRDERPKAEIVAELRAIAAQTTVTPTILPAGPARGLSFDSLAFRILAKDSDD